MDKSEELENKDLFVFLVRMEDVTERMNIALDSVSDEERSSVVRKLSAEIVAEATDSTHYNARVKSFFGSNDFYLIVYETFNDVRLVGAPPCIYWKIRWRYGQLNMAKTYRRFALFRVYCGLTVSLPNILRIIFLIPQAYFPISLDGVQDGDFSMIMGFPGLQTDTFLLGCATSY